MMDMSRIKEVMKEVNELTPEKVSAENLIKGIKMMYDLKIEDHPASTAVVIANELDKGKDEDSIKMSVMLSEMLVNSLEAMIDSKKDEADKAESKSGLEDLFSPGFGMFGDFNKK